MKIENYKENHINLQIKLDNLIQAKKALIREELKIKYYKEINLNTDILKNNLSDIITRMTMLRDDVDKYFTYKNYNNDKNNDEYDNDNNNDDKNNDEKIMMMIIMMIKIMIMMMIILKNVNLKIVIEKPHIVN